MNKPYEQSPRFNATGIATGSILALILTMAISTSAHAENRCSTPGSLTAWEKRACELAKLDSPDELRLFIQRTSSIYGLYFYDYVSQQDIDRWDLAREHENTPSIKTADDRVKADHR